MGNSFGGIVAMSYALDDSTLNPASMVLSSSLSDMRLHFDAMWDSDTGSLGRLPPYTQERINSLIQQEAYDSDEFQTLSASTYPLFAVRTFPPPSCFADTVKGANPQVALGAVGPASKFVVSPNASLADFNITSQLHEIRMPVLLTAGAFDAVRPVVVDVLEQNIPITERLTLSQSAHFSMLDEPGQMNDVMVDLSIESKLR